MSTSSRWRYAVLFVAGLSLCAPAAAQEAEQRALGRRWTCDATIFLTGTSHQYTPPTWGMKTGDPHAVWGDREKSCRSYIEAEILTGAIWSRLQLSLSEQERICKDGRGDFRVEYGFDKRPKSWSFTKSLPAPRCDCELRCKAGYDLDTTSSPGHPRCVRLLCEGAAAGIPDDRFGPHDNGVGIWGGNVYHHQPVQRGPCTFEGSGGRWSRWLDRDDPSGSGDFEPLKTFVQEGKVCADPTKIECRLVAGKQLVQTGLVNGKERYRCDLAVGGVCDNRRQDPGIRCSDYEVRFRCP